MKKAKSLSTLLGLLLLASVSGHAATITTLFGSDNGGSPGGAVYFDLTVGANPITITGFETNTSTTSAFDWTVYITTPGGTRVGNEANAGAWTQVATGSGTGLGTDKPSIVNLDNTFSMLANTTYGVALVFGSTADHDYTNGNGSNQNYSNGDLSLVFGSATNVPFSGTLFSPRVWNGSIEYTVGSAVPEPSTISLLLIGGAFMMFGARRRKSR